MTPTQRRWHDRIWITMGILLVLLYLLSLRGLADPATQENLYREADNPPVGALMQ